MSTDLGDLTGLGVALGLLEPNGTPQAGWFADPARYLKTILTDDGQREALLETADDLLGGSEATHDDQGRTWLPVFENDPVAVFVVLDDSRPVVHVALGVRVTVVPGPGEVGLDVEAYVPLFAAGGSSKLLLGQDGATVEVSVGIELPPTSDTGSVSLSRVEAAAQVPTWGPDPAVSLALRGLRLPGATTATDVVVEADRIDELDDALLDLVLGLVHAATDSLPAADPARGLAGVLGLVDGDGVPELPVADVIASGPMALAAWLAECLTGSPRASWLGHLATLLDGSVVGSGDTATVRVPIDGGIVVVLDVATAPGTAGLPVVTPRISVEVDGAAGATLALTVEPVSIDLATGAAVAVPSLSALARVGSGTADPLLGPVPGPGTLEITVGSFEGGFALDADRRPLLVLAALDAVVGQTPYARLDLTDGDALAGVAAQAVIDAAATLLNALGPVGDAVGVLLGLTGPEPHIDPVALLTDPIGALRARWLELLAEPAATVRSVLQVWQETTAAAAVRDRPITGEGTPANPYRVALTDDVDVLVTRSDGAEAGSVVSVVLAAALAEPLALGAEARADVRVGLLRADLSPAAPSAQLVTGLLLVVALAGVEGAPIRLTAESYGLSVAGLGARVAWDPAVGARVDPWLDDLRLLLGGLERSLAGIGAGGPEGLELPALPPVSAWAPELLSVLEDLAGALLGDAYRRRSGVEGPQDAAAALLGLVLAATGWADDPNRTGRLSLAGLVTDPGAELRRWVDVILAAGGGSAQLPERVVGLLARLLGSPLPGAGVDGVPWALTLPGAGLAAPPAGGGSSLSFGVQFPSLALALGAPTADRLGSRAPAALVGWMPGDPGLSSAVLAEGISADAGIDDVLGDALAGRGPLADGLDALIERWGGTDGVVALPDDLVPAGVTAHRPSEVPHTTRLDSPVMAEVLGEVWEALGGVPDRIVHVGVVADGEPDVLPPAGHPGVDLELDLTLVDASVEAFPIPAPAPAGTTAIRLAGKAAAAASGAGDGFTGQVARLRRAFEGLTGGGTSIVVVAAGAAGQPAVQAAGGLGGVSAVVTVGTPWTALSLDDVDTDPAAGALRMLRTLIDLSDADLAAELAVLPEDERAAYLADDEDFTLARGLVGSLLARDGRGDPLTELSAPELPLPAGLAVHAVIGSCSPDAVRRAVTAAVAAGLAGRSRQRVAGNGSGTPGAAPARGRLGLHLPAGLGAAVGGLRVATGLDLDLIRASEDGIARPTLRVRLRIAGDGRWLAGGPDAARAPGPRPLAVRAATLDLTLALPGWGIVGDDAGVVTEGARLVLHDATAFGIHKARWLVDLTDTSPLLPEARALLGEVAAQLEADADEAVSGLVDALTALGILDAAGGFDSTTLATLLADPAAVVRAALADAARTVSLAAGLRSMVGDAREAAGSTIELRTGDVTVTADLSGLVVGVSAGLELAPGGLRVDAGLALDQTGAELSVELSAGGDLTAVGPPGGAISVAASIPTAAAPTLTVTGTLRDPRGPHSIVLWPAGPETLDGLVELLPDAAAATALSAGLAALRSTLTGLEAPEPAALVDVLLTAAGLLSGSGEQARVTWPSGLVSDPKAWLEQMAGDPATVVPELVDAVAGLMQPALAPPAGTLPLTDGVDLRTSSANGRLTAALAVDATEFAGELGDLVLLLSAGASLAVTGPAAGSAAVPDLSADVGATGIGTLRVRVGADAGGADGALGVTVSLVPDGRPEIALYPATQGLSGLADAATAQAVAALPPLLTRLAAEDPADPAPATTPEAVAGRIVGRAGRALGLASGTPAVFDEAALAALAADPAAVFEARAAAIAAEGLALVVDAAEAVLDTSATRSVTTAAGRVALTIGPTAQRVTLGWNPGTGAVDVAVTVSGLTGVGSVSGSVTVSGSGIDAVDVAVGPAPIPVGTTVTLAPYTRLAAGSTRPGPTVDVGLGAGSDTRLVARFAGTGAGVDVTVLSSTGALDAPVESSAPEDVALAVVATLLDISGAVVLGIGEVQTALGQTALGTATVTDLLDGVVLTTGPVHLDAGLVGALTDPDALLRRLGLLVANAADAMPAPLTIGDVLDVRVTSSPEGPDSVLGLTVAVSGDEWIVNPGSDIRVGLVSDASWISQPQPAGVTLEAVRLTPTSIEPAPGVIVGGVGVRFSRASGPLLDTGLTIDAVSLLGFGLIRATATGVDLGGGARVEIAGLGVPLRGGGNGSNPVAEGLMPAGGADEEAPAPRFSPALAVQKHPGSPLELSLVAGTGSGPWWLAIQREFGPIYLEQVGLAVDQDGTRLKTIGVLIDGKVSLFGLSAAVDDLSFTYTVDAAGTGSPFDPDLWRIDVAGFAVTADLSGVTLAGGLRKFTPTGGGVEYLGMLLARLSVYGLTMYGGFGRVGPPDDQFDAFFLFGAVNGPIGGPPAFFVTGIGGGFGANRDLVVPADLSQFGTYPLIKALDPAARPGDPFAELEEARVFFPAERGQFWFAAGLSFNSFAVVDGVVVVAVEFGNGFELNILGLARMALPDESVTLVSIELALVARVSTEEGVVLVQAQLTDNSWLLSTEVRLTGGFAFASWFAGPNRGQFVLTLGGYHPDFHRDGYPVVPRLGLSWRVGDLVSITGESYFALTSEALMAGMRVEIHASIGPAWAHLVFGADGIVYFDPFFLNVTIYASIDAGVTIDLWFAEVTISVHLSARLTVTGPPFRAVATFEVGPVSVTFALGPSRTAPPPLTWVQFVPKYLEEASPGVARALAAITGAGTVPPAGGASSGGDQSPDGQPDRPFRVVAEFTATVTSTIPITKLVTGGSTRTLSTSRTVSVAPMGEDGDATPTVTLRLRHRKLTGSGAGGPDTADLDQITALESTPLADGAYPVGVWGEAQDLANPKVPAGDVIAATDRIELEATAIVPGAPPAIPYRQVEVGKRRVNPLLPSIEDATVDAVVAAAAALHGTIDAVRAEVGAGASDTDVAAHLLLTRGERGELEVDSWRADLASPVLLGSLGEGLARLAPAAEVASVTPTSVEAPAPREPRVLAVLSSGQPRVLQGPTAGAGTASLAREGTTVSNELLKAVLDRPPDRVPHLAPVTRAGVGAALDSSLPARLAEVASVAQPLGRTIVAAGTPPVSGLGPVGAAAVSARAGSPTVLASLRQETSALLAGEEIVADGRVVVLELPDANTDTDADNRPRLACRTGRVRIVLLGASGRVLADNVLAGKSAVDVPVGTRTVVVLGGPPPPAERGPWWVSGGWAAGRPLPSASDGLLVAAGSVVDVLGAVPYRGPDPARVSWASPTELLGAERGVATTLAGPGGEATLAAVAVALTGSGTDGLAIGLRGASQRGELVVTTDASGAGVAVAALDAEPGTPVRITVATDPENPRGHLGVVGVAADLTTIKRLTPEAGARWLAQSVAEVGLTAITVAPTAAGPGRSTVAWEVP